MIDPVRIQDVSLMGVEDPKVLEWAAQEGRVLLSHDEVSQTVPVGVVIDDVLLIAEVSLEGDWEGQVLLFGWLRGCM